MDSDNPTGADNQQETSLSRVRIDPKWIAGFVDGEGCFSVSEHRNNFMHRHWGWQIQTSFHVYQHLDHQYVLEKLRDYFGCGHIRSKGPRSSVMTFCISALRELDEIVVPFFEKHELLVKAGDFAAFSGIVRAMKRKEHLTDGGFEWIVRTAYQMNANGKRSRTLEEVLEGSSETAREATSTLR